MLFFGAIEERSAANYYRPPKSDVLDTSTRGNLNLGFNLFINDCSIRHEHSVFVLLILVRHVLTDDGMKSQRTEPVFQQ